MTLPLNILVIGPSCSGKSCLIASLILSLQARYGIRICSTDGMAAAQRQVHLAHMRDMFDAEKVSCGSLCDDGGVRTRYITEHTFKIDAGLEIAMKITEIPGKLLDETVEAVTSIIADTQVVFITIDTPVLMKGGFRRKDKVNIITNIIKTAYGELDKTQLRDIQIQFVPLKCEKYFQPDAEIGISDVNTSIKEVYSELIDYIHDQSHLSGVITPAQTVGDLVFENFDKQKVPHYKYLPDARYNPKDCDQPFLYALDSVLRKYEWPSAEDEVRGRLVMYNVFDVVDRVLNW